MNIKDINIRDPFVFLENDTYYMYGTVPPRADGKRRLVCYQSDDLVNFDDGTEIFCAQDGFWGTDNFWAPELHKIDGKYYISATFKSATHHRATHLLTCDTPCGRFVPVSDKPLTPPEWDSLDGTIVFEDNVPYFVFCHEWIQIKNGEICAAPLSADFKSLKTPPVTLFSATAAPWVVDLNKDKGDFVTDGPFYFRGKHGLYMLWSSFSAEDYAIGVAKASSGHVIDSYVQSQTPLLTNGGHGMIFTDKNNKLLLAIHSPNHGGLERARFIEITETADGRLITV